MTELHDLAYIPKHFTRFDLLSYLIDCLGYRYAELSNKSRNELCELIGNPIELEQFTY